MEKEKRHKYFVSRQDTVTIRCTSCGRIGTFSVAGLRGRKHSLRVNCPCSENFAVDLEFRRDFRIKSHIPATFRAVSTPKARARHCIVANQSSGGLLLQIGDEVPVKIDDRLIVCYRPREELAEEVERIITVRHYERGAGIGGAFLESPLSTPLRAQTIALH